MVARRSSSGYVPSSFLAGASCLLPLREVAPARVSLRSGPTLAPDPALTPAEARVLEFLLRGLCNKEIAAELGRAEATIKNQVASILHKHRVPSRARLLAVLR